MPQILDFYKGKTVLITGATGFLGVCLLEKILRSIPEHGTIYLLLRAKKDKQAHERLEDLKKNKIFDILRDSRSEESIFAGVKAIAGDVGQEGLGLSAQDRALLVREVEVLVHSAATLDFGESLRSTVTTNLLGTRRIAELAKECQKLKALVHVSSAYVNAYNLEAEEVIYDAPCDADELMATVNSLNDEELEAKTLELLGKHLNTYTITKHLAEHEIKKIESIVPCTIVRPSMIIGAWKEPVKGWTISKNGPQGFLMGAAKGVIRRLPVGVKLVYDYIPVDIVVNTLLAAGYSAGTKKTGEVEVYHCTSSTRNPFTWSTIQPILSSYLHTYPLQSAVWYPYLKFLPSITWYRISALFVHLLPAILLDAVTSAAGGRPILKKLHRNVNSSLNRLEKFIFTEWKYFAKNTEKLSEGLSKEDRELFNLDIKDLDWPAYFKDLTIGARVYLNNEPLRNLEKAKSKDRLLMLLDLALQALVLTFLWYLVSCILSTSMTSIVFVLPILYVLVQLL